MRLHHIKRPIGLKRSYRRVGRGQSSGRGKQSGRGGKGQTARAGAKMRPEWRDIIKKLPKRRGFGKNRRRGVFTLRPQPIAISLSRLVSVFESGSDVTPASLLKHHVVYSRSTMPRVKIIGNGVIKKKLLVKGVAVSAQAKMAIEKAGGSVE